MIECRLVEKHACEYVWGVYVCICPFHIFLSVILLTWNWYFRSQCLAVESSLLTMSTHHYRKQFEPKLGLIVHTCAKNFGSCCSLNTSYLKEVLFSRWFLCPCLLALKAMLQLQNVCVIKAECAWSPSVVLSLTILNALESVYPSFCPWKGLANYPRRR